MASSAQTLWVVIGLIGVVIVSALARLRKARGARSRWATWRDEPSPGPFKPADERRWTMNDRDGPTDPD